MPFILIKAQPSTTMSKLTYVSGDIFSSSPRSILVHACNAIGTWGAGISLSFRDKYPQEFEQYKTHCKTHGKRLVGTCLLIKSEEHDIACLFTSRAYGKKKDTQDEILEATKSAIIDLLAQNTDKKELHAWYDSSITSKCAEPDPARTLVDLIRENLEFLGKRQRKY